MQNSEYLALPIVCQRIYSDVLWHYMVLYNRTVWAWNSPPPHLWSSLPWLLSRACYDIHMEGSALLFLRLFGLFYPLSACIQAETQSHVQAWTWESGLLRPNPASWPVDPCARSPAVSVKRTTLHTQCVLSGSLGVSAPRMLSFPQGFYLSWGFSVFPCSIFQVLYTGPIAAGLQLNPGHAEKAHCSA